LAGETEVLGENAPAPLCPPQIPHDTIGIIFSILPQRTHMLAIQSGRYKYETLTDSNNFY
jgi:hypothetical protein